MTLLRCALLGLLVGCGSSPDDDDDDGGGGLLSGLTDGEDTAPGTNPSADDDGDGFSNAEEAAAGSDPNDAADVPYAGGWVKDSCRDDIVATGNDEGQVAQDFGLVDQYGETVHLYDFCNRVVLIEFAGFSWGTCTSNAPGLEYLYEEYGADGFIPMMVMYDGDAASIANLAEEKGLTFPVLDDSQLEVFGRWDPARITPNTTLLVRGAVVEEIDATWYNALIEELIAGE